MNRVNEAVRLVPTGGLAAMLTLAAGLFGGPLAAQQTGDDSARRADRVGQADGGDEGEAGESGADGSQLEPGGPAADDSDESEASAETSDSQGQTSGSAASTEGGGAARYPARSEATRSGTETDGEGESADVTGGGASSEPATTEETAGGEKEPTGGDVGETEASAESESGEETPVDERGELIDTEESTRKTVSGRGTREGDRRLVQTGVNTEGVPGYQHLATAAPVKTNTYRLSFNGEVAAASDVVRAGDDNRMLAGRFVLHAMFMEYVSANIGIGARNNVNDFGRPRAMLSQGDLTLGVRGHYRPVEGISLAADGTVYFTNGFGSAGLDFAGTSFRPRLIGTFDLDTLAGDGASVPLNVDVNLGYRLDNTQQTVPAGADLTRVERYAHEISAYDSFSVGVGVEYDDLPYVAPYAAWKLDVPLAPSVDTCSSVQPLDCPETVGFASYPDIVSLGLRAEPVEQLGLHAGVDVSLTGRDAAGLPATPPYRVLFGASWSIDPEPRVERIETTVVETRQVEKMPPRGTLVGTVRDAETGDPVGDATIRYADRERSSQTTDAGEGTFRSYQFSPDTVVSLEIDHPGYHATTVEQTVTEGESTFSVELEPKPKLATVTGTVLDLEGEPIADATVSLDGPASAKTRSDSGGEFELEVEAGDYTLAATAPEYLAAGRDLSLEQQASVTLTLQMSPEPESTLATVEDEEIAIEQRITFETGKATLKDESKRVLEEVAALLFKHPAIARVEVQGHTDDVGSEESNEELSRNRAEAVVSYLTEQGVAPARLAPEGYGESQPKVPNVSARNRQMNRRVEFDILRRE